MNKMAKKNIINIAQIVGLIAVTVLLWYILALISDNSLVVPRPRAVIGLVFQLLGEGAIWLALLATLARSVLAFVLSLAFAFGLALLAGVFPKTRFCTSAVVTFLRALPTVAVILISLIIFRSSVTPVVVAFLVVFPVIYDVFVRKFQSNSELFDVCKVYDVTPANKVKFYILPLVRDELLSVTREQLPLAVKVVIAGEVLALPIRSLGREMYVGKVNLDTARVIALTVLSLTVCFVLSGVLSLAGRRHD